MMMRHFRLWLWEVLEPAENPPLEASSSVPVPEKEAPRVWLDYVNLRQCGNDFSPAAVIDLIKTIGVCFIEFDEDPTAYLARTFCALEAFACVKGDVKTGVLVDEVHAMMIKDLLAANPVQVAKAQTRRRKDKDMIDNFIIESVGFEAVDAALTLITRRHRLGRTHRR